jgi:hypothetical protein
MDETTRFENAIGARAPAYVAGDAGYDDIDHPLRWVALDADGNEVTRGTCADRDETDAAGLPCEAHHLVLDTYAAKGAVMVVLYDRRTGRQVSAAYRPQVPALRLPC